MIGKVLPVAVALVVLAVGTVYQGILSERWKKNRSEKLLQFAEKLGHVPKTFGDWTSIEQPLDKATFKRSGCEDYISRLYRNNNGDQISVFLVVGTAQHITQHTPDWCYRGAGYEMEGGDYVPYTMMCNLDENDPEFSTATFIKESATKTDHLRIFWGYTDDGQWEGPRLPKVHYAQRSALYKLYLITQIADRKDRSIENSSSLDFAKEFVPLIEGILFPEKLVGIEDAAPEISEGTDTEA